MPSSLFPAAAFIYNLCKRPSSALHIYMGPEEKNEGEETASCDIASRLVLVTRKLVMDTDDDSICQPVEVNDGAQPEHYHI